MNATSFPERERMELMRDAQGWGALGREFYDRKVAEGKTSKEAIRALKRRLADVVYRHLVADARQQT
jgi:hypothetical protein